MIGLLAGWDMRCSDYQSVTGRTVTGILSDSSALTRMGGSHRTTCERSPSKGMRQNPCAARTCGLGLARPSVAAVSSGPPWDGTARMAAPIMAPTSQVVGLSAGNRRQPSLVLFGRGRSRRSQSAPTPQRRRDTSGSWVIKPRHGRGKYNSYFPGSISKPQ